MLDVRRLRTLLAVRDEGSIAAAARTLAFTPPAVSQQLAALERQLGVELLDRERRAVRLTPAGQRLATRAEGILAQLEAAAQDVVSGDEQAEGPLGIGSLPTIGTSLLPYALVQLRQATPAVRPYVVQMEAEESLAAVKRRELDVALVGEYAAVPRRIDAMLERHDLFTEPVYVAVPAGHRLAGDAVRMAELGTESWVAAAPGSGCHTALERTCGLAGFVPDIVAHCGDFAMLLAMVGAGLGVGLVPALAGEPPPGVRYVRPLDPAVHRTLILAVRRGGGDRPVIRDLGEALTHRCAGPLAAGAPVHRG